MRKTLVALGAVAAFLAATLAIAEAPPGDRRDLGQTALIQALNGSPVHIATVSTDGGIAANTCSSPAGFGDAGFGDLVMVQCSQDHYVRTGTCSTSATTNSMFLADKEKFYTLLRVDEMAISALPTDGGIYGACRVYHMR